MRLCVRGVCVVVFRLYNILLALTWVHGHGPDPEEKEQYDQLSNMYKIFFEKIK